MSIKVNCRVVRESLSGLYRWLYPSHPFYLGLSCYPFVFVLRVTIYYGFYDLSGLSLVFSVVKTFPIQENGKLLKRVLIWLVVRKLSLLYWNFLSPFQYDDCIIIQDNGKSIRMIINVVIWVSVFIIIAKFKFWKFINYFYVYCLCRSLFRQWVFRA